MTNDFLSQMSCLCRLNEHVIKSKKTLTALITALIVKFYNLPSWTVSLSIVPLCTPPKEGPAGIARDRAKVDSGGCGGEAHPTRLIHPHSICISEMKRADWSAADVCRGVCVSTHLGDRSRTASLVPARLSADTAATPGGEVRYSTLEKRMLPCS